MVKEKGVKEMKKQFNELEINYLAQDTILSLTKYTSFHKIGTFRCYMGDYKDNTIGILVESYCCIFIYDKENSKSIGAKDITGKTFDDYRKEVIKRYGL